MHVVGLHAGQSGTAKPSQAVEQGIQSVEVRTVAACERELSAFMRRCEIVGASVGQQVHVRLCHCPIDQRATGRQCALAHQQLLEDALQRHRLQCL